MRGEPRAQQRHRAQARSPADALSGAEGPRAALGAARRAAWAPILLRVAAGGLALVGLAGIGVAARKSPELGALVPRSSVGLAQLSGSIPLQPSGTDVASVAAEPPIAASSVPSVAPGSAPRGPASGAAPAPPSGDCPCSEAAATRAVLPSPSQVTSSSAPAGVAGSPVDLNSADARQLQRLPGVGAKRASAIIELRERLGGFRSAADLLRIRGIGRRTLERMAPQLVVGARVEPARPPAVEQPPSVTVLEAERPPPPRSAGR